MSPSNYDRASYGTVAATAILLAGATTACTDLVPAGLESAADPVVHDARRAEVLMPANLDRALPRGSTPRVYFDINEKVPGFSGLYLDEEERPVVLVTPDGDRESARVAVEALLAERGISSFGLRFRIVEHEWRDLLRWRLQLREAFTRDGIVSLGIDEKKNRVRLGVVDPAVEAAVQDILTAHEIPPEAVDFAITERRTARFAGGVGERSNSSFATRAYTSTLEDRVRPLVGGLRINDSQIWGCTYGAGVDGLPDPMFVTASHCATVAGDTTSPPWEFYQPDWGEDSDSIPAWEAVDPDLITSGPCPSGTTCRWADATLARMEFLPPEDPGKWAFGEIARPASGGPSGGTLAIAGSFYISDHLDSPIQGQTLHKVGASSGWSYGIVQDTCEDEPGDYLFLCQARVSAGAAGGDSGSPVFYRFSNDYVKLAGILWGGDNNEFWFSPMSSLEEHFGAPLDVAGFTAPPPPSVTIQGPTLIEPDATCTWTAQITSGDPPYSYDWTNHNQPVAGDDEYTGESCPDTRRRASR